MEKDGMPYWILPRSFATWQADPTQVKELVQQELDYVGYCGTSAFGAGGVWFGAGKHLHPIVWQVQWPKNITDAVISTMDSKGHLTNSDLEMAGVLVVQEAVLEAARGPAMMVNIQQSKRRQCSSNSKMSPSNRQTES
jgi:hypothetical protein